MTQKAYLHLIKHALADGKRISVGSEGEIDLKLSTKYKDIKNMVENLGEATMYVRNADGSYVGNFLMVPGNTEPEETLADYTVNEWTDNWWELYNATIT